MLAARSTRATNLWAGSSNKTYVVHTIPRPFPSAGVELIKQSRTNYLLDISGGCEPGRPIFSRGILRFLPPSLPQASLSFLPSFLPPTPVSVSISLRLFAVPLPPLPRRPLLSSSLPPRPWDYSNVALSRVIRGNTFENCLLASQRFAAFRPRYFTFIAGNPDGVESRTSRGSVIEPLGGRLVV